MVNLTEVVKSNLWLIRTWAFQGKSVLEHLIKVIFSIGETKISSPREFSNPPGKFFCLKDRKTMKLRGEGLRPPDPSMDRIEGNYLRF